MSTESAPYQYVRVNREERVTVITIDRADARNALNRAAHEELHLAFNDFAHDDTQWIAIVTGAGDKAFCAGQDLKEPVGDLEHAFPATGFGGITSRHDLHKPVIAAVNGMAFGGGFEIALACDLIVAHERAEFAVPEVRVGLAAVAGGFHRLPRVVGLKRAMGMLLTGRRVGAQEGLAMGFVHEVVDGDVLAAARRLASEILACSPMSVRATKEAVRLGLGVSIEDALEAQWRYPAVAAMFASADAAEGPAAFAAKRAPVWRGR